MRRVSNLLKEPKFPLALNRILNQPQLVVERQLEIGNIIAGWEQGRTFHVSNTYGQPLAHLEETNMSLGTAILRQLTKLHRPFTINMFSNQGEFLMNLDRKFMFINSKVKCTVHNQLIGESQQEFHILRRRYNLFTKNKDSFDQFGRIDSPFLSYGFDVLNSTGEIIGSINRNWSGIGREVFTDTGVYLLTFGDKLSLSERCMMLSCLVSIDFDYFSRHSHGTTGFVYYE